MMNDSRSSNTSSSTPPGELLGEGTSGDLVYGVPGIFSRSRALRIENPKPDKIYRLVQKIVKKRSKEAVEDFQRCIMQDREYTEILLGFCELKFNEYGSEARLTMRRVEGEPLQAVSSLNASQTLKIIASLLKELMLLAKHGFVHGDVKAPNIILKPSGQVKLIDYGMLDTIGEKYRKHSPLHNNPNDMPHIPPECFWEKLPDGSYNLADERGEGEYAMHPSQDIYGLGYVFYFLGSKLSDSEQHRGLKTYLEELGKKMRNEDPRWRLSLPEIASIFESDLTNGRLSGLMGSEVDLAHMKTILNNIAYEAAFIGEDSASEGGDEALDDEVMTLYSQKI